jgi:hypothetical protein
MPRTPGRSARCERLPLGALHVPFIDPEPPAADLRATDRANGY